MGVYDDTRRIYFRDSQIPFVRYGLPPRLERQYMTSVRSWINGRMVPCFLGLCAVLLILITIFMSIDEARFTPLAIVLFGVIGVMCVAMLLTVPKTRKWELASEEKRWELRPSERDLGDRWSIKDENLSLEFTKNGLRVDNDFCSYSQLSPRLATSHRFNRVWLALQFGTDPDTAVYLPLTPDAINAVEHFSIPLENDAAYRYLLQNKTQVFAEIYNKGSFHTPDLV